MTHRNPTTTGTGIAPRTDPPGTALRERERRAEAMAARIRRCRALGQPGEEEIARLVAAFHASGGQVTRCPPAHLLPVRNGAGRDAGAWTV